MKVSANLNSIASIVVIALLATTGCKKKDKETMSTGPTETINQPQTTASDTIGKGTFSSFEHGLGGNALLYNEKGGGKVLRFTNFNMTPGPDVYVYLSKSNNYSSSNVITLMKLTSGYSNSSINFTVPSDYTSEYKYALVYCVQYKSLFGYAELK